MTKDGTLYKYYEVTIRYMVPVEKPNGKIAYKSKKDVHLVNTESISLAQKLVKMILGSVYEQFQVVGEANSQFANIQMKQL